MTLGPSLYQVNSMRNDLAKQNWENLYTSSDVNFAWNCLKSILSTTFDLHAPFMTKNIKGKICPWLTIEIKACMNERDKMLRFARRNNTELNWKAYKNLRNRCTNLVKKAKQDHYKDLLTTNINNPRGFWKTIKSIIPINQSNSKQNTTPFVQDDTIPIKSNDPLVKAGIFCSFFSTCAHKLKTKSMPLRNFVWNYNKSVPIKTAKTFNFTTVSTRSIKKKLIKIKLHKATGNDDLPPRLLKDCASEIASPLCHIVNLSLKTGIVPTEWKVAKVTPIHKSGPLTKVDNYRPISILPVVSKILENIVHEQLSHYLEENFLLSSSQFGYRSKRSTELAATLLLDNIRKEVDKGR